MKWDDLQHSTWDQVGSLTWEEALNEVDCLIEKFGSSQEPLTPDQVEQLRKLDVVTGGDGSDIPVKTGNALSRVRDIIANNPKLWADLAYIVGSFIRGLIGM